MLTCGLDPALLGLCAEVFDGLPSSIQVLLPRKLKIGIKPYPITTPSERYQARDGG